MDKIAKEKAIEVCKMVADDTRKDAEKFDGQPFTGKTVAEYFGCQGAAIAALADVLQLILEDNEKIMQLTEIETEAKKLCEKFVNKVEDGRARSVETYADCKALLEKIQTKEKNQ